MFFYHVTVSLRLFDNFSYRERIVESHSELSDAHIEAIVYHGIDVSIRYLVSVEDIQPIPHDKLHIFQPSKKE